jgi:hypothetical protein
MSENTEQERRLANGAELRQYVKAVVERGEKPTGYRADWLITSADSVLIHLDSLVQKFNEQHPDDMASLADLLDIIMTARKKLLHVADQRAIAEQR